MQFGPVTANGGLSNTAEYKNYAIFGQ